MILKMNNKCEDFYAIMGKIFGSRIVENETHDRIYDDNKKNWYVYVEDETYGAFVSVIDGVIKNIYCIKEEVNIKDSIVTKTYLEAYEKSGLIVDTSNGYKNFVIIKSKI